MRSIVLSFQYEEDKTGYFLIPEDNQFAKMAGDANGEYDTDFLDERTGISYDESLEEDDENYVDYEETDDFFLENLNDVQSLAIHRIDGDLDEFEMKFPMKIDGEITAIYACGAWN